MVTHTFLLKNYLRLSVTDRCNLRCFFCMPGIIPPAKKLLSYEEIINRVQELVNRGVNKVRITGGEPLLRPKLVQFVKMLSSLKGIDDISMTTNAILLSSYAKELKQAGLKRVNISMHSQRREIFAKITGKDKLKDVYRGVEEAFRHNLKPVKINVVLLKGINEDELETFASWTLKEEIIVRFIELMPLGIQDNHLREDFQRATAQPRTSFTVTPQGKSIRFRSECNCEACVESPGAIVNCFPRTPLNPHRNIEIPMLQDNPAGLASYKRFFLSYKEAVSRICAIGKLRPWKEKIVGNGPAEYFSFPRARGKIGFISAISRPFCATCNRLRLSAEGEIRNCLFSCASAMFQLGG